METVPLGVARNEALSRATGEYIAFLDSDDLWCREKLEQQMACFGWDPALGAVYTDAWVVDDRGLKMARYSRRYGYRLRGGWVFRDLLHGNFIAFSSLIVRRSVLEALGGFHPWYQIVEDYDCLLRLAYRHRIGLVPEPLVLWRLHDGNWSRNKELAVAEVLDVYGRLESSLGAEAEVRRCIRAAVAETYYRAGKSEMYAQGLDRGKARACFVASLRRRVSAKTAVFWLMTFGPQWLPLRARGAVKALQRMDDR